MDDRRYEEPYYGEPYNKNRRKRRGSPFLFFLLLLLLTAAAAVGGVMFTVSVLEKETEEAANQTEEQTANEAMYHAQAADDQESDVEQKKAMVLDVSDVVKAAMPSIVAITSKTVQEVQYFFRGTAEIESESSGSGFIIGENEEELLIATNYHVIEGAASLSVCFSAEDVAEELLIVEAVEKGSEPQYDLAVIAVRQSDIPEEVRTQICAVPFGVSGDMLVGQPAIAIGNALGYGQSVTLGIISAKNRILSIDGNENIYLQTDAAINFGNSGGALLNVEGQVIGINSAKAASSGVEGMGYAIPIDDARPILEKLINRKTRQKAAEEDRGYLGIYTQNISSEARSLYNIPNGVYIESVEIGSAAERAGLKRGDILSGLDGNSVTSTDRLSELLEYFQAGETVTAEILTASGGEYSAREVTVTFDSRPERSQKSYRPGYGWGRTN